MNTKNPLEVWLRGPVPEIIFYLQPVVHALMQAREEVNEMTQDFTNDLLWEKPGRVASAGFHLQHLTGVLDRLFTYARGEALNDEQLQKLAAEGNPESSEQTVQSLVQSFNQQVECAIQQLQKTIDSDLSETRFVGRSKIPSTVLGLLFHAAEHTQRHVGQLFVTINVLRNLP